MMEILHCHSYILNTPLGARSRFLGIIEQSKYRHLILSTPSENIPLQRMRRRVEYGANWEIREIVGYQFLTMPGGYFLTWLLFRLHVFFMIKKNRIKIIHVHNANSLSVAAADVAQHLNIPVIFEAHVLVGTSEYAGSQKIRIRERELYFEKMLVNCALKVIVQTEIMRQSILKLYRISNERILIIPNFVNLNIFDPQKETNTRIKLRNRWQVSEEDFLFLYAGFLNWYNGIPQLLGAFSKLPSNTNARLMIFGQGELTNSVHQASLEMPGRVLFMGDADSSEMPGIYMASDCVVLPRPDSAETREATPMKLLEAMAMEKVVICTTVKGMLRIANHRNAVLVPPDDVVGLTNSLLYVINNFAGLLPLRKRAREHIIEKNNVDFSVLRLDNLYQDLLFSN